MTRDKHKQRGWRLKNTYGISLEEYEKMLASQDHSCKICKKDNKGWYMAVDHCHETNKVRGLLCNTCNRALGLFNEDPKLLETAADYLRSVTH